MSTTKTKADFSSFASTSVPRHLARGFLGFGSFAGSMLLMPVVGPVSLALLPAGMVALRGCPTCWTFGLVETISRGRLQRRCADGRCELHVAPTDAATDAADAMDAAESAGGENAVDLAPFTIQLLDATALLRLDAPSTVRTEERELALTR